MSEKQQVSPVPLYVVLCHDVESDTYRLAYGEEGREVIITPDKDSAERQAAHLTSFFADEGVTYAVKTLANLAPSIDDITRELV